MRAINQTISIDQAWNLSQDDAIQCKFNEYITVYKLNHKLEKSPYWAYWFARQIIMDKWPNGESLIAQDPHVKSLYDEIINFYKRLNILDNSLEVWPPLDAPKPTKHERKKRLTKKEIEELADELAESYTRAKHKNIQTTNSAGFGLTEPEW